MSRGFEVYQLLTEERIREHHRVALKLGLAAQAALRRDPVQEALAQTLYGVLRRVFSGRRRAAIHPDCPSAARDPFL